MNFQCLYSIFIKLVNKPSSVQTKNIFAQRNKITKLSYLALIILFWKLDINVMLSTDVCNDGTLSANDFWVIFGVHSHS